MFRMYASNSHSYTHLILALGIVREPTVWVFITSQYPGIHDIGLATLPDTCCTQGDDVKLMHEEAGDGSVRACPSPPGLLVPRLR